MSKRICSICTSAIPKGDPIAVAELSTIRDDGQPLLERSIVCSECTRWARTFLRPQPVLEPGESCDLEHSPSRCSLRLAAR